MGRAKLKMELITKEKIRNATYHKRKAGMFKKANEFTILCDVDTLMIIYPPNSNKPEVWPENNQESIDKILSSYKSKKGESGKKCCDLNDFFLDRKRKIEDELSKARKKNLEAKYATWSIELNHYSEDNLRKLALQLEKKENIAKTVLEIKKSKMKNVQMPITLPFMLENTNNNNKKQPMFYNYMGGSSSQQAPYFQVMNRNQYDPNGWLNNAPTSSFIPMVKNEPISFSFAPMVYNDNNMMMMNQLAYQQAMMQGGGQMVPDFVVQDMIRTQMNNGVGDYMMNDPRGNYQG